MGHITDDVSKAISINTARNVALEAARNTSSKTYTRVGSDVLAPGGSIDISARVVDITEARESSTSQVEQKFKQSGLSVSVGGGVLAAAQGMANTAKAVGDTTNARMQALGAATLALQGQDLAAQAQNLGQLGDASSLKDVGKATGMSLNISLGSSKRQSTQSSQSDTARGSAVLAGGDINVRASGAGEKSDITVRGRQVQSGGTTSLKAEGDVLLLAAQNTTQERSRQSSSSGSIGVSINASGVSMNANASKGRGQGAGDGTSYTNTQIGGRTVQLESGGGTTLQGAVVSGERVTAKVGGDLKIESLQDTATFDESSRTSGFGVSVPVYGAGQAGASVSAGKTRIDGNFASVSEQSAIRAGDGGFDVQVKGATDLKGGAITSTQAAIDQGLNTFNSAGGLTTSDIHNTASFSASSTDVTVGVGSLLGSSGAGIGSDQGSASSVTTAAISGIAGNKAARTGDAETGLAPIFDKERVRDEVEAQVAITKAFGQQAGKAIGDYAQGQMQEAAKLRGQAASEADPDQRAQLNAQADQLEANWSNKGALRLLAHSVVGALTGGAAGAAGAASGTLVAPAVADALSSAGIDGTLAKTLTAIASTTVGLSTGGIAGGATALNEVTNNYLSHQERVAFNKADKACKTTGQQCDTAADHK